MILAARSVFSQATTPPPMAVTYTEAQAARGAEVFGGVCIECHARKDVSDVEFKGKWRGRSAFAFFDRVRSTMPESNPGSLTPGQYLDVVAYIAKLNGMTGGAIELPNDEELLKKQILAWQLPPNSSR